MASTDTPRTTNPGGDPDAANANRDDQGERLAHAGDNPDWNPPKQGMRTHHVVTANDAQAQDQRADDIAAGMTDLDEGTRDKLGTPVSNVHAPEEEPVQGTGR